MSDKDVELKISADSTQAEAAFGRVGEASKKAAYELVESFEKIQSKMEKVNRLFEKMAGLLALGFAGEKIVEGARHIGEYADEIEKSSQKSGIAAEKLQGLQFAAKMSDISTKDLDNSLKKLAKAMEGAGAPGNKLTEAFAAIGLKASDLKGMKTDEVLAKVADAFANSKDGAGKAAVALELFGKSGTDMIPFLNKGSASINELVAQAQKMGLVLGGEALESGARLNDQFKLMDAQIEGLQRRAQLALIPAFLQITNAFSESTQQGGVLAGVFDGIGEILLFITKAASYLAQAMNAMGITIGATAAAVVSAVHGDFAAAKQIMAQGDKDIEASTKKFEAFRASLEKPIDLPSKPETFSDKGKNDLHLGGGAAKSLVSEWKAELEQKLEVERNFFKSSQDEELKFWQSKLALITGNSKQAVQERQQVQHEIFALEKRQAQEQLAAELEDFKLRAAAYKTGSVERIQLAGEAAAKIGEKYGLESKEYKAALREMEVAAREHQAQLLKLEDERIQLEQQKKLQGLEMDKLNLDLKKQLGQISATQELQALRDLEDQKYQIELQALRDKAALYNADTQEYADAMRKIEEMAGQHQIAMQKINNQIVIEQKNEWTKMMEPLARAIDQSAQGIVMGTTTMQKALANIYQSVLAEFISMQTKRLIAWVAGEQAQTAATAAGIAARNGAEQAGAGQSMMLQAAMAIKKIMNSAAETFGGIFAFLSPTMGPAAAAPAAVGMGAVSAMTAGVMSASRGYDIPAGINPMTQLHQQEMVLPAHLANPMRDMLAGGGNGGDTHVHIHASDAESVRRLIMNNGSAIMDAIKSQARGFNTKGLI